MNYQTSLITPAILSQQSINFDNIRATFTNTAENFYDIVLELNSNKFLINIEAISDSIEKFEILSTKWFVELSNKIIMMLKNLVQHLLYRLD